MALVILQTATSHVTRLEIGLSEHLASFNGCQLLGVALLLYITILSTFFTLRASGVSSFLLGALAPPQMLLEALAQDLSAARTHHACWRQRCTHSAESICRNNFSLAALGLGGRFPSACLQEHMLMADNPSAWTRTLL